MFQRFGEFLRTYHLLYHIGDAARHDEPSEAGYLVFTPDPYPVFRMIAHQFLILLHCLQMLVSGNDGIHILDMVDIFPQGDAFPVFVKLHHSERRNIEGFLQVSIDVRFNVAAQLEGLFDIEEHLHRFLVAYPCWCMGGEVKPSPIHPLVAPGLSEVADIEFREFGMCAMFYHERQAFFVNDF